MSPAGRRLFLAQCALVLLSGPGASLAAPDARAPAEGFITSYRGRPAENIRFAEASGRWHDLAEHRGKVVVLNYWATWCGPCKVEMPTLARLSQLRAQSVVVLAVAEPQQDWVDLQRFWSTGPRPAGPYRLEDSGPLRRVGAIGLPYTIVYDRNGREWARLPRGFDWSSPGALAVVDAAARAK